MKKILSSMIIIFIFISGISSTFAQTPPKIGLDAGKQAGGIKLTSNNPDEQIGAVFRNIIVLLFTVGALGFIIMFVWGTVDWILSGGDKEKIAGARKRIVTAITGLVLLSLTFIATAIIGQILGLCSLRTFKFIIPSLTDTTTTPCE